MPIWASDFWLLDSAVTEVRVPSATLPIIHALVPVKSLAQAKSRLRPLLTPSERQQLVIAMLYDVLAALAASTRISTVSLVSTDPTAQRIARQRAAHVIVDHANLNVALSRAARMAREQGAHPLIIFADLPLVTADEIDTLLAKADGAEVVLAAARDGGTNALFGGDRLPLSFGVDSLAQHTRAARTLGLRTAVVRLPGLERDIDQPADVCWLAQQSGHTASEQFVRSLSSLDRNLLTCV